MSTTKLKKELQELKRQVQKISRERDIYLMELTKLENMLVSPEQPRTKRGLPPSNDPEVSAFVDRNKVSRTPKLPAKPNETLITSSDFPVIEGPVQPEESILPAESDEEVDNAMESEAAETVEPETVVEPTNDTETQQVVKADKPICIVDGASSGFQDHIPFATELHRVCKEAVAINIRKLSKGGWLVMFKDHENLNKFMDPWVWAQKPFGGAAKAHPPSEKRVVIDKPHPLEKVVKATRVPKEVSDHAFKDFLVSDGWKVSTVKSLPPATNLIRPPSVKNVLVTFESQDDADKALRNGLRFQCFFIRTEQFIVYPDPGITRCFKCQSFGHIAARCEGVMVCSLCGVEGHGWQSPQCPVNIKKKDGVAIKLTCANCNGEHHTGSRSCTLYKAEKRRLYSEMAQKTEVAREKASAIVRKEEPEVKSIDLVKFTESLLRGLVEATGTSQAGSTVLKRLQLDLGGLFNRIKLTDSK